MNRQRERSMTPLQFKRAIKQLGMSQAGAGRFLGVSERTARRMMRGEAKIPAAFCLLLRSMIHYGERAGGPAVVTVVELIPC